MMGKMEVDEGRQFREGLVVKLRAQNGSHVSQYVPRVKSFANTGVNCDRVTEDVAMNISSTAKLLEEYSRKIVSEKNVHNQTFGEVKATHGMKQQIREVQTLYQREIRGRNDQEKVQEQHIPKFSYKRGDSKLAETVIIREGRAGQYFTDAKEMVVNPQPVVTTLMSRGKYTNEQQGRVMSAREKQQHVIFKTEVNHQQQVMPQQRPSSYMSSDRSQFKRSSTFTDYRAGQLSNPATNFQKPYRQDGQKREQQLINKLDLSSSQYSGMFDDDDIHDSPRLQCKVQVILQISSGSSARLQIYNLQLYSNDQLRILSLYDREFQRHKLVGMRGLPNGYYQLVFGEESKVRMRKCKFRGGSQPFGRFLQM